ncbi:Spy/CpxP family protein refolding chaperone [Nevskia sp.]|uniref:Spy/CpxP family protein refolding chaperone n=1 Tax=Nevskia sp. TaxID=1929292 RepID=UPI0025DCF0BA|nr:Spy/CpxP family protein refolding chaperone [Nevskia sp.]
MNLKTHLTSKKTALAAALCAGLMIAAPQFANAQPPAPDAAAGADRPDRPPHEKGRHGGPRRGAGPFMHELKSLDLSDAQRSSVRDAIKAQWQSARDERVAARQLHRNVEIAAPDSPGYSGLINQLADAEANEARDRVQKQAALKSQIFAMLTPAQKTALTEKLKNLPEPPARPEKTGFRGR